MVSSSLDFRLTLSSTEVSTPERRCSCLAFFEVLIQLQSKTMTHTLMKCNLMMALVSCVQDCSDIIGSIPKAENLNLLISKALECRATCMECMEAFENSKRSIRGLTMQAVRHACNSFLNECSLLKHAQSQKCVESCRRCIEECENLISRQPCDQDSYSFFLS